MNALIQSKPISGSSEKDTNSIGYIYILAHKTGRPVKIGETRVSPNARLKDYSKTYKLNDFSLSKVFKVPLSERKNIEKQVHRLLKSHQLSCLAGAREIFNCDQTEAEKTIKSVIDENAVACELRRVEEIQKRKEAEIRKSRLQQEKEIAKKQQQAVLRRQELETRWDQSVEGRTVKENLAQFLENHPLETEKTDILANLGTVVLRTFLSLISLMMILNLLIEPSGSAVIAAIFSCYFTAIVWGPSNTPAIKIQNVQNIKKYDSLLRTADIQKEKFIAAEEKKLLNPWMQKSRNSEKKSKADRTYYNFVTHHNFNGRVPRFG